MPGSWLPYDEERRRRQAYRRTKTDHEAAERLGIPAEAFRGWRRTRGLPSKQQVARERDKKRGGRPRGPRLSEAEERRRREAYEATATDAEAAALLGITPARFWAWRKARGLEPAADYHRPGTPITRGR